jgi:hypothetical protein
MFTSIGKNFRKLAAATALALPSTGNAHAETPPEPTPVVVLDEAQRSKSKELHTTIGDESPFKPASDERRIDDGTRFDLAGGAIKIQDRRLEDRLSKDLNDINSQLQANKSQLQANKVEDLDRLSELIVEKNSDLFPPNTIITDSPVNIVAKYLESLYDRLDLPKKPDFILFLEQSKSNRKPIDVKLAFEIAKHSINASAIAQNFDTALERLAVTAGLKLEEIKQDGTLTSRLQDIVNEIIDRYTPLLYPDGNTPDVSQIPYNKYTVTDTNKGTNLVNPYAGIMHEFNRLALFVGKSPIEEMKAFEKALQTVEPYPDSGATIQSRSVERVLIYGIPVIEVFTEYVEKINDALRAREDALQVISDNMQKLQNAFREAQRKPLSDYLEESETTEKPVKAPESSTEIFEAPQKGSKTTEQPVIAPEPPPIIFDTPDDNNSNNGKSELPFHSIPELPNDKRNKNPLPENSV